MASGKVRPTLYWMVFAVLFGLTILTVGVITPADRRTVAYLVGAHDRDNQRERWYCSFSCMCWYSTRLTWIVAMGSIAWLVILFGLTFSDYLTRYWDHWQPLQRVTR